MSNLADKLAEIASPCMGVCTLGPNDICIGCLRTAGEIGDWLKYSDEQRQQIISKLPARLEQLFGK